MKTVTEVAAPGQALAPPMPLRVLDQALARIRFLALPDPHRTGVPDRIKRHMRHFDKTLLLAPSFGCRN